MYPEKYVDETDTMAEGKEMKNPKSIRSIFSHGMSRRRVRLNNQNYKDLDKPNP